MFQRIRELNISYVLRWLSLLAAAGALKLYYSAAGVDSLRWVLGPTAWLTGWLTGTGFDFESRAGYLSDDRTYLIAGSCSGVNFLIAAFLLLGICGLISTRGGVRGWMSLPMSAIYAYIATIVANTARISIDIEMRRHPFGRSWLDPEQMHRVEGILIYFGFLLLLFALAAPTRPDEYERSPDRPSSLRRLVLPLGVYHAITLGVPLANSLLRRGPLDDGIFEHVAFVLVVPLLVLIPFAVVRLTRQLLGDSVEAPFRLERRRPRLHL